MKQFDFKTRHWASFLMLMGAMLFGSVNLSAQITTGTVYGVYCAGNATLYITRSTTPIVAGDTYNGQSVTKVYSEAAILTSTTCPWAEYASGDVLTTIQFDAVVKPVSIQSWFYRKRSIVHLDYLDTSEVTDMSRAFLDAYIETLDLSTFDTRNVTTMQMMFGKSTYATPQKTALKSVILSSFNTSKVTTFQGMFQDNRALTSLDVHNFTNEEATNMSDMFYNCINLETINLTGFGTPKVSYFNRMFSGCSKLETPDFSTFNTSNATQMTAMFSNCQKFDMPNLSTFNTSKVTTMNNMFNNCTGLTELDLHTFDTRSVTTFNSMFGGCSNLRHIINDSDWNVNNSITSTAGRTDVFNGCNSLRGEHGTTFDSSEKNLDRANENGYFTLSSVDNPANGHEGYYWSTYYNSNVSSLADDNTDVFIAEVNEEDMTLVMHQVNDKIINAGQAVILRSSDSNINLQRNYASLAGSTETVYDDYTNVLKGKDKTVPVPTDEGQILTLGRIDNQLGFYKYVGANLNAHKAYIARPVASEAGYRFVFDDETPTGISQIQTTMPTNEDKVYDISGRRVQGNLLKGLYIVNGKKVFVK